MLKVTEFYSIFLLLTTQDGM